MVGELFKILVSIVIVLLMIIISLAAVAVIIGIIATIIVIGLLFGSCVKEVVEDELYRTFEAAEGHAES